MTAERRERERIKRQEERQTHGRKEGVKRNLTTFSRGRC